MTEVAMNPVVGAVTDRIVERFRVPAAIHPTPPAHGGSRIARLDDGDIVRGYAQTGEVRVMMASTEWNARRPAAAAPAEHGGGSAMLPHMDTLV